MRAKEDIMVQMGRVATKKPMRKNTERMKESMALEIRKRKPRRAGGGGGTGSCESMAGGIDG